MISQLRPKYVYNLNMYLKTLEQRNNYLRQIKYENKDKQLLEIWDEKLSEYAQIVYEYRNEFIEKIKEKINNIHSKITQNKEEISIKYITDFTSKEKYLDQYKKRGTSNFSFLTDKEICEGIKEFEKTYKEQDIIQKITKNTFVIARKD